MFENEKWHFLDFGVVMKDYNLCGAKWNFESNENLESFGHRKKLESYGNNSSWWGFCHVPY